MTPFFSSDSCLGINGLGSHYGPNASASPRTVVLGRGLCASLVFAAVAFLASCASTNGLAPSASLRDPNALLAKRSLANAPLSDAVWPKADWWKSLHDPQLDALIDEALAGAPPLNIAAARARKALALADVSGAALVPRVDGAASSVRQHYSENGITPPPLGGSSHTLTQLQATLSWDLDLWGRHRSAYEAALGTARAAEVDTHAARLALSTAIAQAYVELQRAYLQLDVAESTLHEREHIYALTRDRNLAGIDSKLELKQAEAALPATRERIVQLNEVITLTRNQLAALLGAGPDRGLALSRPTAGTLEAMALPSAVPAELLGRRPDLIAQRWRIESARHDIDSAKAEFYPNVNLLAFAGLQSLAAGSLFTAGSRMLGAGPAVTLPIFDGGRLRGNLAATDADYDIAVEQYNQAIADAMRDVVDQLASLKSVDEQRKEQRMALAATREAYDLALLRYREGLGNYLQVLSAEQPMLIQESLDADLRARELAVSIDLIRALGGGFEPSTPLASAVLK